MNHGKYTAWRKSRHSNTSARCLEVACSNWRKSTYSDSSGDCGEVATTDAWPKPTYSSSSATCVAAARQSPDGLALGLSTVRRKIGSCVPTASPAKDQER